MVTEKLYENNGMLSEFDAKILSAEAADGRFRVILDRTAFFPEGGGQTADTGFIGESRVLDVQIVDGEIVHFTDSAPESGEVTCRLDFDERFRKMQNHLGEHLLCGAIHKMLGFENVGFHLGADYMTFDVSGPMTREQIDEAERMANEAVVADVPVVCRYPSAEELETLDYRAKSEKLDGVAGIRIVSAGGYDACACCAPHLDRTGRVGLIKIVDSMHYKGGMRFFAHCGFSALADYKNCRDLLHEIAVSLSAKTEDVSAAFSKKLEEISALRQELAFVKRSYCEKLLDTVAAADGKIVVFDGTVDDATAREFVNGAVKKADTVYVFYRDGEGYKYVVGSTKYPLKERAEAIKNALGGRCGGSDRMLFGFTPLDEAEIRRYLANA